MSDIVIDAATLPDSWTGIVRQADVFRLLAVVGMPQPSIMIDIGFGAGNLLMERMRCHLAASHIRHLAFDPLEQYHAFAAGLGRFGVEMVPVALGDRDGQARFVVDPDRYCGYLALDDNPVPEGWHIMDVPVACLDTVAGHQLAGQSVWIHVDVGGAEQKILAGATRTLAAASVVSIVLDIARDPDTFYRVMSLMEGAGFRCYRIVDFTFAEISVALLRACFVFVRLDHIPDALPDLDDADVANTMKGLAERRERNIALIKELIPT